MTRETRIGLVVGLLFIVMFALVLSELTGADSYLPIESLGGVRQVDEDTPVIEVIDGFTSRPVPPGAGDPSADVKPVPSPGRSAPPAETDAPRVLPPLSAVAEPEAVDENPTPVAPAPRQEAPRRPPEAPLAREDRSPGEPELPRPVAPGGTIRPFARTDSPVRPAPAGGSGAKTYVVKPNDTLTRIAQKTLNDDSPSAIRRICEANPGKLDDPNLLSIGLELAIPSPAPTSGARSAYYRRALADLDRELKRRRALGGRRPADAVPTTPAPSRRVYKVRRGDNLTKIAREMLRDGSRSAVRRILNANKDKIRNANVLPIGVELVIPS